MKRNSLWMSLLAVGLLLALTAGGCAKKQVVSEGEEVAPSTEQAPAPPVRETPIAPTPSVPPPAQTPAVAPAPVEPVPDKGLSQPTPPGLQRIHFDFDKFNLKPDARDALASNAEYMKQKPGVRIRIEGHCDERGTTEYNLALGERRADSAFQYLIDLGVDPNRMGVVSYGEEQPLDPGHDEAAWAQNRRAEFVEIR